MGLSAAFPIEASADEGSFGMVIPSPPARWLSRIKYCPAFGTGYPTSGVISKYGMKSEMEAVSNAYLAGR